MAPLNLIQTEQDAIGDDVVAKRVRSGSQRQSKRASTISSLPGARKKFFLKSIRNNKSAMNALGLESLATDSVCLQVFKDKFDEDELENCFLDAGVKVETIKRLLSLFEMARDDIGNDTKRAILRPLKRILQTMFIVMIILSIAALILYLGQLGWVDGKCGIRDFANRTCHQGNKCNVEVRVLAANQVMTVPSYAPPVGSSTATQGTGILLFSTDGPFRCCNEQWKLDHGSVGSRSPDLNLNGLGAGVGSGVSCCSLWDPVGSVFCDTLGTLSQYPNCPKGAWDCSVKMKEEVGKNRFEVVELRTKSDAPHEAILYVVLALAVVEVILLLVRLLLLKSELAIAVATSMSNSCMNLFGASCHSCTNAKNRLVKWSNAEREPEDWEKLDHKKEDMYSKVRAKAGAKKQQQNSPLDPPQETNNNTWLSQTISDDKSDASAGEIETESESGHVSKPSKIIGIDEVALPPPTAVKAPSRMQSPGSRPATRNVSSMFRPIISPPVKTRPKNSKKHGLDVTGSSFSVATDDAFGLTGRSGFASTFTDGFGADSERNFAAATYSGGFGRGATASLQVQPRTRPTSAAVSGQAGSKRTRGAAARTIAWSPQPDTAGHGSKGVQSPPRPTNSSAG